MARDRRFYDSFKDESGTIYVSDVLLPDQIVFTISFTSQPQKCSALAAEQMACYMRNCGHSSLRDHGERQFGGKERRGSGGTAAPAARAHHRV